MKFNKLKGIIPTLKNVVMKSKISVYVIPRTNIVTAVLTQLYLCHTFNLLMLNNVRTLF